jgi:hypothetical protein
MSRLARRGRALALAAACIAPIAPATAARSEAASRTIDRTLACSVRGVGSPDTVRYLDVYASPRAGKEDPAVRATTAPGGAAAPGAPPPADSIGAGLHTGRFAGRPGGSAWLNMSSCSPTRSRVAFSTKGLRGGQVARFGESYRCDVPARVLIRIRAVFTRSVTLRPERGAPYFLSASGSIVRGALAVTSANGNPIVYASVDDTSGKTQVFTSAARCFPT